MCVCRPTVSSSVCVEAYCVIYSESVSLALSVLECMVGFKCLGVYRWVQVCGVRSCVQRYGALVRVSV